MEQTFTEAELPTRYGDFRIRVYNGDHGEETVVIYTRDLDSRKPVLTRVHSECLTGDIFGSLRCDCGEQLALSLELMNKEGGILVYLRQEGRGIGLYDKIQSYQLQQNGYDTYDANVALGHQPDERSYEDLGKVFKDLGISKIRLLTNNSSKVDAITRLGIEITERVPIKIEANSFNEKYLATKREKFKHLL